VSKGRMRTTPAKAVLWLYSDNLSLEPTEALESVSKRPLRSVSKRSLRSVSKRPLRSVSKRPLRSVSKRPQLFGYLTSVSVGILDAVGYPFPDWGWGFRVKGNSMSIRIPETLHRTRVLLFTQLCLHRRAWRD
jgi:hypothetical protein